MTPFYNMVKLGFLQNIYATTPHYITNSPKRHYQRKNAKSIPKYVLLLFFLDILFRPYNDLIEFAQTKSLKIHELSRFDLRLH